MVRMRSIFYSSSSDVFQLVNESVNEYSQQLSILVDVRFLEFTTVRGALENMSLKGVGVQNNRCNKQWVKRMSRDV